MITFALANPITTLLIVYFIALAILYMWRALLKALIISKHGYPPDHCDAFGDDKDTD